MVTGESVSMEELGGFQGPQPDYRHGHFVAKDDADCLRLIKKLLGYLPSNHEEEPPPSPARTTRTGPTTPGTDRARRLPQGL